MKKFNKTSYRKKSFTIPLGYSTTVYITPKATEIDEDGEKLPEEKRNCRLEKDNQNLGQYKLYTKEACLLECKINQAHQHCGCFPWNYLITKKEDFNFCDIYGNICFDTIMSDKSLEKACNCPMNCNRISYSFSYNSERFDPEEICLGPSAKSDFLMKEFYENPFPNHFIRNLRKFNKNETSDAEEICKKNSHYRAKITFRLATDYVTTTIKTRRLNFFDMLSGIGIINSYILYFYYNNCDFRRNSGIVYWDKYSKCCGSCILDCQILHEMLQNKIMIMFSIHLTTNIHTNIITTTILTTTLIPYLLLQDFHLQNLQRSFVVKFMTTYPGNYSLVLSIYMYMS